MMPQSIGTIGLLYAGEMGAALAAALRARGARVITTLEGRSPRTAARCRAAGIEVLNSLADVVRESPVVICLVPPHAAEQVADSYCEFAGLAPPGAIYVDANSTGPESAQSLIANLSRHGVDFVDAAINGLAKNLSGGGTIFLSGARATGVAHLLEGATRVWVLGRQPGRAKTMKMLLGGMSKGVCALFVELARLARRREMLPEMIEAMSRIYPGIAALIERMLPTYARHAPRRAAEMYELEQTVIASGIEPCAVTAVRTIHEMIAGLPIGDRASAIPELIEQLARGHFLAAQDAAAASPHPNTTV
jgi:3-hydroxyisobutyrate dehydrogenase-like beta-hydroxyacid dehydrogenase